MKKTKIFLTAGILVLAIAAVFANKANKAFFVDPTNVYYKDGATYRLGIASLSGTDNMWTITYSTGLNVATFVNNAGTSYDLYESDGSGGYSVIYKKF